jgi:hypothetical protein
LDPNEPIAWANGPFLVMRKGAELPDRCVKCNAPANGRTVMKRFLWADTSSGPAGGAARFIPLVRVIMAFGSLFRWLSDLRTMQVPRVRVGICGKHRIYCRLLTFIAWFGIPLGVASALLSDNGFLRIWSVVLGIAVSAIAARSARPVAPVHVGIQHVTLRGVGTTYLQSLNPSAVTEAGPRSADKIADSVAAMAKRIREERSHAK